MSDLRKAFIDLWMALGYLFFDLAQWCFQRAGKIQKGQR